MYICEDCGVVVEEIPTHRERVGEGTCYDGYETVGDTCSCGGNFVEAEACKDCGDVYSKAELHGGYCNNCLVEYMVPEDVIDYALKAGAIPTLLLDYVFDENDINGILLSTLKNALKTVYKDRIKPRMEEFCKEDLDGFARYIKDRNQRRSA